MASKSRLILSAHGFRRVSANKRTGDLRFWAFAVNTATDRANEALILANTRNVRLGALRGDAVGSSETSLL